MEIFLGLAALVAILYFAYLKIVGKPVKTDLPEAGVQIDKPAEPAPKPVPTPEPVKVAPAPAVTAPLDVNKDGKVDLADAKEVVKQTVARVKSSTPGSRKRK
jgi:hypothetical protein